jgi:hypothetical protein
MINGFVVLGGLRVDTSEEEHTTDDSGTAGEGRAVHIGRDIRHVDLTAIEEPTERAFLRIELRPESEKRILSMVAREKDYEKRVVQVELWLTIIRFTVFALAVVTLLVFGFTLGGHQNYQWLSIGVLSFSTAIGGYLIRGVFERFHARHIKASDDLSRDISDD